MQDADESITEGAQGLVVEVSGSAVRDGRTLYVANFYPKTLSEYATW